MHSSSHFVNFDSFDDVIKRLPLQPKSLYIFKRPKAGLFQVMGLEWFMWSNEFLRSEKYYGEQG